jgi:plasmid stabilization system protein ParE
MVYQILWTNEAEITLENNLEYLEKKWNVATIIKFIERVNDILEKISVNPKLFPLYRKKDNIYKCVITRQITIYYKINSSDLIILSFWNTYQDDNKSKF